MSDQTNPITKNIQLRNGRFPTITWKHIAIVGVLLLLGVAAWMLQSQIMETFTILSDQEAVSAYIQSYGPLGPLVLFFFHLLQVIIAFIPGHVFVVAGGYVYGLFWGIFLNILFVVIASQIAFIMAQKAGRPIVNRFVDAATVDKWTVIADKKGFLFFTIAFVLPVFPTDAMNFVAGLSGMSGWKFLAASALGRFPSIVLLTLVGSHGIEFSNSTWFILAILVATVYIVGRITILRIEREHTPVNSATQPKTQEEIPS